MRSMGQNPTEDEVSSLELLAPLSKYLQVLNLVIEYDVNGDGTIDFDEFLEMMRKQAEQQDNSAELREAFKIFDRDGNGYIDAAELKKVTSAQLLAWILTPSPHSFPRPTYSKQYHGMWRGEYYVARYCVDDMTRIGPSWP